MNNFLDIGRKKDIIRDFLFFQAISIIVFFSFIQKHFSVDTYFLFFSNMDSSHSTYNFVISSGRLIPGILYFIFQKLNVNVVESQVLIFLAGLFVFALSMQIFYNTALKVFKNQSKKSIFLFSTVFYLSVFIGGMAIFSTPFALFQFALLFLSLAFKFLEQEKFFLSIVFAVLSLFVYQAWFPLFLVLFFVYLALKLNKSVISSLFYTALVYILGFGLNYLFIKIYSHLLNSSPNNRADISLSNFLNSLQVLSSMIHNIFVLTFGHFGKYYFVKLIFVMLIIIVQAVFLVKQKISKYKYLIVTFFSILILTILPLIPSLFGESNWIGDRYVLATGSMVGVLYLIFLFLESNRYTKIGALLLVIIYLISITYTLNKEAIIIKKVNQKDEYLAKSYAKVIDNYQKKSGIEIKNIEFAKDKNPKLCKIDKCMGDLSLSSFVVDWSDLESLNYYNKRLFKETNDIDESYCKDKNWDEFKEEQLVFFEGDSVLICVY